VRKVNLKEIPLEVYPPSPSGKFRSSGQKISIALGHVMDSDSKRQSHPFDLELCTVPPGASPCPYHAHSAQSELYLVISGTGQVRAADGYHSIATGDALFFHPGEPHQIINDGPADLVFYIIADNPIGEGCYYPDSNKWGVPNGPILKGEEVDYYYGEE
jgi:uncharacterized cupin superfamily protein